MKNRAFFLILILMAVPLLPVFADKYDYKSLGILQGDYNKKNGALDLKGLLILPNKNYNYIKLVGVLKEWNYEDSSIPNCRHAFSDDMTMLFDRNSDANYAKIVMTGKICSNNWNDTWKSFRGNYVIIGGKTLGTDEISGQGVITITINTKSGETKGTINGNIALYT